MYHPNSSSFWDHLVVVLTVFTAENSHVLVQNPEEPDWTVWSFTAVWMCGLSMLFVFSFHVQISVVALKPTCLKMSPFSQKFPPPVGNLSVIVWIRLYSRRWSRALTWCSSRSSRGIDTHSFLATVQQQTSAEESPGAETLSGWTSQTLSSDDLYFISLCQWILSAFFS